MNIYEIMLEHYAQRGSEKGIFTYLAAQSDEEVYEWLKSDPTLRDERSLYTSYKDNENDEKVFEIYDNNYEVVGEETFKERMIRLKGDLYDEDADFSDLYYGKTLIGWKLAKEDVTEQEIKIIQDAGISLEVK